MAMLNVAIASATCGKQCPLPVIVKLAPGAGPTPGLKRKELRHRDNASTVQLTRLNPCSPAGVDRRLQRCVRVQRPGGNNSEIIKMARATCASAKLRYPDVATQLGISASDAMSTPTVKQESANCDAGADPPT
jgi:hypothetical protein